jgi:hypothetical protein
MGPAMISEVVCKTHPDDFMLWNRRAYVALNYVKVKRLPRYDYQLTGKVYRHLCSVARAIGDAMGKARHFGHDPTGRRLLHLGRASHVESKLTNIHKPKTGGQEREDLPNNELQFIQTTSATRSGTLVNG